MEDFKQTGDWECQYFSSKGKWEPASLMHSIFDKNWIRDSYTNVKGSSEGGPEPAKEKSLEIEAQGLNLLYIPWI